MESCWIENVNGEQFGKERVRQIVAASSDAHPEKILEIIVKIPTISIYLQKKTLIIKIITAKKNWAG